ncbi:uncharacterized protein V6R79_011190 [Siganus canaliculatus]
MGFLILFLLLLSVQVTLCANTVKTYELALAVDIEGVGKELMTLPIKARCLVPEIAVETPAVDTQRRFLLYPYTQTMQLINSSDVTACYCVLHKENESELSCNIPLPRGAILSHSSQEIFMILEAKSLGKLHHTLYVVVFGSNLPPLEVVLSCSSQGPVVHVQSTQLHFGKVKVLKDCVKSLDLSNQSPIPAFFTAHMRNDKSCWRVEPSQGILPQEGQLKLRVVANLKDVLPCQDKLDISIQDSLTHTVHVSATGTGTSVVSDKPLAPTLDLGPCFSHESCQYNFKLTNCGSQPHILYWRSDQFSPQQLNLSSYAILPPISAQRRMNVPSTGTPVFSIQPSRVELFPGSSADMVLMGSSASPKAVSERLLCYAKVHGDLSNKPILSVDVSCHFVSPTLSISTQQLNFSVPADKGQSVKSVCEKLVLTNPSPLSLSVELSLPEPFSLCETLEEESSATAKSIVIDAEKQSEVWVRFNPAHCVDLIVDEILEVYYQGCCQKYEVKLHAEILKPVIRFSSTTVDFGCVALHTVNQTEISLINCSTTSVSYSWTFVDDDLSTRETEMLDTDEWWIFSTAEPLHLKPDADAEDNILSSVKVFNISPVRGCLPPQGEQQVSIFYYSHDEVSREVVAQCHVKDGATHKIRLQGKASVVRYSLSSAHIDYGPLLFDRHGEAEVILRNVGEARFKFSITDPQREDQKHTEVLEEVELLSDSQQQSFVQSDEGQEIRPGEPMVIPTMGYLDAGAEQSLHVFYLPGIPEVFERRLQLQVAHLPHENIIVTGEGVFPRISLDLPQNLSEESLSDVVQQAQAAVTGREELPNGTAPNGEATAEDEDIVRMEVERILVKENALAVTSILWELGSFTNSSGRWSKLNKCLLPEYVLNFGHVSPGQVLQKRVTVTNNGLVAVSFSASPKALTGTGFRAVFEKTNVLHCQQTQSFTVDFNAQSANLKTGAISAVLPIKVASGPTVPLRLCAVVTTPSITVSTTTLQFDTVPCGMRQMKIIQLFNPEPVPCHWSMIEEKKPLKKKRQAPPAVIKVIPCSGKLASGERVNVQIRFCPAEGHAYSRQLVVHVAESTEQVFITVQGQGEDPLLEFCPSVLELGPCLPAAANVEAEVTVKNPCSFPIEFFCMELHTPDLREEKILHLKQGPPRAPGQSLPEDLLDSSKEGWSQQFGEEKNSGAVVCQMWSDLLPELTSQSSSRDITIIVYGAPLTAKSSTAAALAHHYRVACLSFDAVVTDALTNGTTPASLAARQHQESSAALHEEKMQQVVDSQTNAHPQVSATEVASESGLAADPKASHLDPKAVAVSQDAEDLKKPEKDSSSGKELKASNGTENNRSLLSLGGVTMPNNLLPEQLLIDILMERFQLNDCCYGVVIDGLESVHTQSAASSLQMVLKARNNHKHTYVVNLFDSYTALKARNEAKREAEEARQKEKAVREEQWLEKLKEEEYDALPEEEKKRVNQLLRDKYTQRKLRERQRMTKEKIILEEKTQLHEKSVMEGVDKATKVEKKDATERNNSAKIQSSVNELQSQFHVYEQNRAQIEHVLQHWDRTQGTLVPPPCEEASQRSEDANKPKRQRTPVEKTSKKASSGILFPMPAQMAASVESVKTENDTTQDAIPHLEMNLTAGDNLSVTDWIKGSILPPLNEVLDDFAMGLSGPLTPPPFAFSVGAPPPKERQPDDCKLTCDCFTFLVPSRLSEQDEDVPEEDIQPSIVNKPAATTPKRRTKTQERAAKKDSKDQKGRESARSKKHVPSYESSTPECTTPQDSHQAALELKRSQRLPTFHWVVPANDEVVLRLWFYSDSLGKFEQTFNFKQLGMQRQYQLHCRGMCAYPSISPNYKTLFGLSKMVAKVDQVTQKTYVIEPGYFEFGPLLCGKTRDRYKDNRFPENSERVVIHNNSSLETEVQFSFQHDNQATTYLLDPPAMTLKPNQKQELTVWAYPTTPGNFLDSVVCHVKDNPELTIINFSCWGVWPELKLESKQMQFGKVLVQREEMRGIMMLNNTELPVHWKLQGVEKLSDEFSAPRDEGVIPPGSSYPLALYFKAKKPMDVKKVIRLEVSDVENFLGIIQTENIYVTAEAFDVSLDISPDGCLDFGTIKVFQETKLFLKLANQGKYKIAYKFTFQHMQRTQRNVFTVTPQSGVLMRHEKPTTVQILCRPTTEVSIIDQPLLSCQVIEPSIGNGGETIATIAIKLSVQAVFSRYKITPSREINFGPLALGTKKNQSFIIENNGVFKTCFKICTMIADLAPSEPSRDWDSLDTSQENRARTANRPNKLSLGVFTVSPCGGSLEPGSQQVVMVNCAAEQQGICNQDLVIDISDRDPSDQPGGIPYRLVAEICKPGIALDMASIFEEHHLCPSSSQLLSEQFCNAEGIYVQDENKFIFNKVLVGCMAEARFKLSNNGKVPCSIHLAVMRIDTKMGRNMEAFDLPVTRICIPSRSHSFATVTFTPQFMQVYRAVFELTIEGTSRMTPTFKTKVLTFDLMGVGNLPSVCVVHPALRNSDGSPVMRFRRVSVGHGRSLRLVLLNDGNTTAQVHVDMLDKYGVFTFKAPPGYTCSSINTTQLEGATDQESQLVHRAILRLDVNQQVELEVTFLSDKPLSVETKISVRVEDNQYSNTEIQVTAEASKETVSLQPFRSSDSEALDEEDDEGDQCEVLNFGHCHVDHPYQESFTLTNHSGSQVVRFEWPPAGPHFSFSPQEGHLHAGCSKEVTVTFRSKQPVNLIRQLTSCELCQVEFQQPIDSVADWDDRQKTALETNPEPSCSVVEGSQWKLDVQLTALCDFVKFSCESSSIHFEDTVLYQSRRQQLQIVNTGQVKLDFSFQVLMDPSSSSVIQKQGDKTLSASLQPGSNSVGALTGERPTSTLANIEPLPPISIEPSAGAIAPGAVQDFSVCFSPQEVAQFQGRLFCSIPNLQDGDQSPCISVSGCSLLPLCHFNLEDSDYIISSGRDPNSGRSLDPNTKVIEFGAIGLCSTTRCFTVLNPTTEPYSFKWRCEDSNSSTFRCFTPCGTIQPGERVEVHFEYVAEQMDAVESSWSFVIDALSLTVPFLCVGTAREPLVYLDRPYFNFGELLVGRAVEQTVDLVNGEEEPFHFSIRQSSLLSDDQRSSLIVQPMTGFVAPRHRFPLSVSFTPSCEGCVRFRLLLKVKRKTEPLVLVVKADCHSMKASVEVEGPDRSLTQISSDQKHTLDFGKVEISEKSIFNFLVTNQARVNLNVSLDLKGPSDLLQYLELSPKSATVDVEKQLQSSLTFGPRSSCTLQDVRLSIRVKHGPTFTLAVTGNAVTPHLEFSFTKYNFGKCFLYHPGMLRTSKTLVISNKGKKDVSVQCQFKDTSYLQVDFEANVVPRGAVMEVPITFCPQEAGCYHEQLTFIFSGSVTKHVDVLGEGVELKLEVEEPSQRNVKLGSLVVGQKVKRTMVLVNRSSLAVSFTLQLQPKPPLERRELSVSPAGELTMKARVGSQKVEIQFTPLQHIPPFTTKLQADFQGWSHPLLTLQGSCPGVEVQLDTDYLAFGAVVKHCKAMKKIALMNTGNKSARFHWDPTGFPPELSITPAKGLIYPEKEVPFEVTFAPVELSDDSRYENLSCSVEGSTAITLTVTGSCIEASTSKEEVNFVCPVRKSDTQILSVTNPTNLPCKIQPVIEGKHWSAESYLTLNASQRTTYEITYRPLTMTATGERHMGSVSFFFPDGSRTLYNLQGTAEPPKAEDIIVHKLPAKTQHTQLLPVHNWLARPQQFHVLVEFLKPDKPDATVSLRGPELVDVPALDKMNYNMTFYSYKEGQYNAKVTFRNPVSGEYLFYFVCFEATSPEVLSTIELVATVRQTVSAAVEVENPLSTVACLTTEGKCADISMALHHNVPEQSKRSLSFQYQPLVAGESTSRLTLWSSDLGYFHYNLLLKALPPPPEKSVHFDTSLGCSHSVLVKFIHYCRIKTKYSCETDERDFFVEKSLEVSPGSQAGSEASVEVCFEPHQLGQVRGQLSVSSGSAGEYIFPLHGTCSPPKAQGPFNIRDGANIIIPFKNVFLETTTFSFQVDKPYFSVKEVGTIHSKKTQSVLVSFASPPGSSPGPLLGKLTISSQRSTAHSTTYSWVYYLKGLPA